MLMSLFLMLTILHIPAYDILSSYTFYDNNESWIPQLSLGALGFSKTQCSINSMIPGNQANLKCDAGRITELIDYGISTHFEDQMVCVRQPGLGHCNVALEESHILGVFKTMCVGQ